MKLIYGGNVYMCDMIIDQLHGPKIVASAVMVHYSFVPAK